jgi:hypothetical protein
MRIECSRMELIMFLLREEKKIKNDDATYAIASKI